MGKSKRLLTRRNFIIEGSIVAGALLLTACVGRRSPGEVVAPELAPGVVADTILLNGKVITVDKADTIAQAVAIKDAVVLRIGTTSEVRTLVGPNTKTIDLQGKTVTPGFVDAHLHMFYYGRQFDSRLIDIRFPTVRSRDELVAAIRKKLETAKKGDWIAGNQGFLADALLNRQELDQIAPDNPVYLIHNSGQFAAVNSQALKLADISKDTPNPYGGIIGKDPSTGEPTGFLYHYPAIDLVRTRIPGIGVVTEEEEKGFILTGAEKCFEVGYTSIQDVIVATPQHVKRYMDVAKEGRLPMNAYMLLYVSSLNAAKDSLSRADHWKGKNYNFAGFKLAVDGGVAAGTALMYDRNVPASQRAYIYHTQETLNEIVTMFHEEGYQVAFHVIGDKAIDMALDAIEHAMQTAPRPDPRHRLEHVIIPTAEALQRIKRLGVIVSTQPCWLSLFGPGYERTLGEEHMKRFMPLKTILDNGIHLAFGSDPPAVPLIEPKWGLIGATTRWTLEKRAITPEESIPMKDALRAYTIESAYGAFEENVRGSLEPGKMADMVVWSHDLYTMPSEELLNLKAEATIVEGQVVYKAEDTTLQV